jgi:hypothetical protein
VNRLQFDGAWEGDVLPGGAFVAAFPDTRLETVWGTIQAPEWIRYPRLHPAFAQVAGQTQNTDRLLRVQINDTPIEEGPACGVSACLYGPDGTLYKNPQCADPYYSQGFRYFDTRTNQPVPAWTTYTDSDRKIYEWTEYDGITVGQGGRGPHGEDPCVVLFNGRRYLLEVGTCRVVRFTKLGDQLAIGFFRQDLPAFVGHWLSVAEIASLLDITDGEQPPPDPEPDMDFPRTEWAVVEQMHQRFSDDFPANEDGARGWTEITIEQLAFSFPSGGWCWKSSTPTSPPSKDAIARIIDGRFECWDVLQAAGVTGPRVLAAYPPIYHDIAGQHPIPVTPENHLDEDPPPPSDDDLEDRVEHLEEQAQRLERESKLQQARILVLEDRVSALEQAPPQNGVTPAQVLGMIDAAFANAEIAGRTQSAGGFLSHSHAISGLSISRKP